VNLYLSESRPLRLSALCVLYVSQGLPDGFVRTGLKTYLIAHGASTADVGQLIALISWPWAMKWVWGPVIDKFGRSPMGRRRPWILAAQFSMGLTMATMLFIPNLPASIRLLGMSVLLINCFSSMQDVAIDALAIDLLPEKERGVANGLMFASSYIGSFLGGAVVGRFLLQYGIREAVTLELLILVIIAMFPLLLRERRGDALLPRGRRASLEDGPHSIEVVSSIWEMLGQLKTAFIRRSSLLAGLLAVTSLGATSAHLVFWPVFLQRQLGWSGQSYLRLEGGYAVGFGLAGSVLGGFVASWLGSKLSTLLSIASLAACWFSYAASAGAWTDQTWVTILFCVVAGMAGFFQVSLFALFMGVCRAPVAATQFSAYMALLNVSSGIGSMLAGFITAETDLVNVFIGLGCFQLAMILVVLLIKPHLEPAPDAIVDPLSHA
jgi:MFS transporter, PAT family, beta-lactamase induction signal transducer AmpG